MPNQPHTADMEPEATNRAIARKMIDEWLQPTADQHAASMERIADITLQITLASMETTAASGVKFRYDA